MNERDSLQIKYYNISIVYSVIAGGGIFGLVWAMLKFKNYNQDWAFYVLYGANGSLVMCFILSLVLLCARAPGYYLVKRNETV